MRFLCWEIKYIGINPMKRKIVELLESKHPVRAILVARKQGNMNLKAAYKYCKDLERKLREEHKELEALET